MAVIKALKFKNGVSTSIDSTNDSIAAKSFVLGGDTGTELTQTMVNALVGGSSDASTLHNHNTQYYTKAQTYTKSEVDSAISSATPTLSAMNVTFTPSSDISASNVQDAIDETYSELKTAISNEVSARTTAVSNEVTARQNADTALSTAISDEATARQTADDALDARLDIIEGPNTQAGSVAKALKDAKDYTDSSVAAEATTRGNADTALQGRATALEAFQATKGQASGLASLDSNGKLTGTQVPSIAITDTFVVASQAAMLAISGAEQGDVAVRTDLNKTFILKSGSASTLSNWQELLTPTDAVQSVNGKTGSVQIDAQDIPIAPISGMAASDVQAALEELENSVTNAGAAGANKFLSNLSAPTSVNQDLLPDSNNARAIGSSSAKWSEVHALKVTDLATPSADADAANKKYVDDSVSAEANRALSAEASLESRADSLETRATDLEAADLTFFKKDGSRAMTGDIDMGQHNIVNATNVKAAGSTGQKSVEMYADNVYSAFILKSAGSEKMSMGYDANQGSDGRGLLNMGQNLFINALDGQITMGSQPNNANTIFALTASSLRTSQTPSNVQDVANKAYVDSQTSSSVSSKMNQNFSNAQASTVSISPASSDSLDLGDAFNQWRIVYGRLFLSRVGTASFGSDFNTGNPSSFESGSSNTAARVNDATLRSGDILSGGSGIAGNAVVKTGDIAESTNANPTGNIILKTGTTAGAGARGKIVLDALSIDANATQLKNLATPTSANDAATKGYVDLITTSKGQSNGIASLDAGGKVPVSQLPATLMEYQGVWNASTNSPTLADFASGAAAGDAVGNVYRVGTAGTRDLGSGSITFDVGDYAILNAQGKWEKSDTTDSVASVNGKQGVVVLDATDVALKTGYAAAAGTVSASDTIQQALQKIDGNVTAAGAAGANKTLSNLTGPTAINQSLLPDNNSVRDIGSSSKKFDNAYINTITAQSIQASSFQTNDGFTMSFVQPKDYLAAFTGDNGFYDSLTANHSLQSKIHIMGKLGVNLASWDNGSGASGDIRLITGAGSTTRGKIQLDGSKIEIVTGDLVAAANTQNIGSTSVPWNNLVMKGVMLNGAGNQFYNAANNFFYDTTDTSAALGMNARTLYQGGTAALSWANSTVDISRVLDMKNHAINNVPTPVNANDAVNKTYVDNFVTFAYIAGETLAQGDLAVFVSVSGALRLMKASAAASANADVDGSGRWAVAGVITTGATAGNLATGMTLGSPVNPVTFDTTPSSADIGKSIFLSTTAGQFTFTPPSGAGDVVVYLGRHKQAGYIQLAPASLRGIS